jgi:UDP-glucose 4-epimerase
LSAEALERSQFKAIKAFARRPQLLRSTPELDLLEVDWWNAHAAHIERVWGLPDHLCRSARQRYIEDIREKFLLRTGARPINLLEIACGSGWPGRLLASSAVKVTGVDFSEGQIAIARTKAAEAGQTNCDYVQMDINQMSQTLQSRRFDGAFIHCGIHHLRTEELISFADVLALNPTGFPTILVEPVYLDQATLFGRLLEKTVTKLFSLLRRFYFGWSSQDEAIMQTTDHLSTLATENEWFYDIVAPSIVVVEYNSRFGPERAVTVPYDPAFVRTTAHHSNIYYGASLAALCLLAKRKDYFFDREALAATLAEHRPEAVFHLAAHHYIPFCEREHDAAYDLNIVGTINVLNECKTAGVQRVFFASTADVYAPSPRAHSEDDALGPLTVYGRTKLIGEMICRGTIDWGWQPHLLIARLFNAVGTRETNPHLVPEIVHQIAKGVSELRLGNLFPTRDFVDVLIQARGIVDVTFAVHGIETVNISSGVSVKVAQMVDLILTESGQHVHLVADSDKTRAAERNNLCGTTNRLKQLIGYAPSPAGAQTIRDILDEARGLGLADLQPVRPLLGMRTCLIGN